MAHGRGGGDSYVCCRYVHTITLLAPNRVRIGTYAMFGLAKRSFEADRHALRFAAAHSKLLPSSFAVADHSYFFLLDYKAGIVHDSTALQRLTHGL